MQGGIGSSLVANERRKLSANNINGIAIAARVVGGSAPMMSVLGTPGARVDGNVIRFIDRAILGGLKR